MLKARRPRRRFGGPGGNITIRSVVYLTQNSIVSASSALAAPGTINIEARITDAGADGLLWSPLAAIPGEGSASHKNSRGTPGRG